MAERRIGEIEVIDNLTSEDAYNALSARQGVVLNQKIENHLDDLITDSDIDSLFN